jgi:glutathione S-transferase
MYQLYGKASSRAFRVLWLLEELGLPYDHQKVAPQSDEVRAHNPAGKVPVLIADDEALTDSTAIMTFLTDRHGALTFPPGSIERARQDGLTNFINDELDAALWIVTRHAFLYPEERRVPEIKPSVAAEFERSINELARRLGDGPFLMGEQMTVPDILAVHCAGWAQVLGFPLPDDGFNAYVERLKTRPAYQRVREMREGWSKPPSPE